MRRGWHHHEGPHACDWGTLTANFHIGSVLAVGRTCNRGLRVRECRACSSTRPEVRLQALLATMRKPREIVWSRALQLAQTCPKRGAYSH